MFANIDSIYITAGIALLAVIVWLSCVQYSEYEMHRKKHLFDEDAKAKELAHKFAWFPYLVIPVIGGILATFCGLMFTDYVIAHGYISDIDAQVAVAIMASIVAYGILDLACLSKVGNVAYFRMVEEKFLTAVDEPAEPEPEKKDVTTEEIVALLAQVLTAKKN